MSDFLYPPQTSMPEVAQHLVICTICFAVVVDLDVERHTAWHKTLTNIPRRGT